jgi:hypothetical protein
VLLVERFARCNEVGVLDGDACARVGPGPAGSESEQGDREEGDAHPGNVGGALAYSYDASMDATPLLDDALATVDKLDRLCCEPGRSPRMAALRETIVRARATDVSPDVFVELLEDAGSQVGSLQVGCCAPGRLPLYADVLEALTRARLAAGPDMHG